MYALERLAEADLPDLRRFLLDTFEAPEGHPPFQVEALRWKAFAPHPYWSGSRCYVVRYEGAIIGHGLAVPSRLLTADGEITSQCVIDWAARDKSGGGAAVLQLLGRQTDIQIGIGGSEVALKALRRMRFQVRGQLGFYRRIVDPVAHNGEALDWKTPLRIARDASMAVRRRPLGGSGTLEARRVDVYPEDGTLPMPRTSPQAAEAATFARTPAMLNYALQCPLAAVEGYMLETGGRAAGYCLLSRKGRECRIADLWVEPADNPERWKEAVALAARLAMAKPQSGSSIARSGAARAMPPASILAAASTRMMRDVLQSQGFHHFMDRELMIGDRSGKVPAGGEIHFGLLENDAFYL